MGSPTVQPRNAPASIPALDVPRGTVERLEPPRWHLAGPALDFRGAIDRGYPSGSITTHLLPRFGIELRGMCTRGGRQLDGYTLLHRAGVLLLRGDGRLDTAA